jgi:GT2 family glycosyltransferase/glycosyltransferase involved in cell wall biosynthesis
VEIVCVTGMHRSGTSLVGGVLKLLGIDLGDEDDLLEPAADNPLGFFESRTVKELNDRVLATMGGRWDDPPPLPRGWERGPALHDVRKDAVRAVQERFRVPGTLAWKDPRLSLTLPFWETVVPISRNIIVLREPDQVAASLAIRNGFEPERSAELWLRYVSSAIAADVPAHLVAYEDFFGDLRATVEDLAAFLGVAVDAQAEAAIAEFFTAELRHHDEVRHSRGPSLDLAAAVHDLLLRDGLAARPLVAGLGARWMGSEREQSLAADVVTMANELEELKERVRSRDERLDVLNHRVQAARRSEDRAHAHTARLEERADRLRFRVTALEAELTSLREQHRTAQAKAQSSDRWRRETKSLRDERAALRRRLEDVQGRLTHLERSHERLRSRKGVRIALALANLVRPLVLAARWVQHRGRPEAAADRPDEESVAESAISAAAIPAARTGVTFAARRELAIDPVLDRLASAPEVTIVVPIHNAADEVAACLEALGRHTTTEASLLLIDDASTDVAIPELLAGWAERPGVRVLRNAENLGFTATVNRGFEAAPGDVVILNSDARVTPGWLEQLRFAAYRTPQVGTVTPLSDNAGAYSAPTVGEPNDRPPHLSEADLARLVARSSEHRHPKAPTGNGFCMYVKRALLEQIGPFDAEAFPRGYGEENDFCMRALAAGWTNEVADSVYVFHSREASFGSEKQELIAAGRREVDTRHPTYTQRVREFVGSADMEAARTAVGRAFGMGDELEGAVPRRILFVIHQGRGGTPQTNMDLMRALHPAYECFILLSDTEKLTLQMVAGDEVTVLDELELDVPIAFGERSRAEYADFVGELLVRLGIELVHIRHLVKHTLDVPRVAAGLGIPIVLSVHDYYLSCPTVHLLDDQDRFCGGICTPGEGSCRIPMPWIAASAPPLKHAWVNEWRRMVGAVLEGVDAMVTTSVSARDVYLRSYPQLEALPFHVIEHGRDLGQHPGAGAAPRPGGPVRILVPGNLDVHKGAELLQALRHVDVDGRLELHFMGEVSVEHRHLGVQHGTYKREEFTERVRAVRPAFIGLFSIWAETYNHTLTEAWEAGVPALVTDLGALEERVRARGGGVVLPRDDVEEAYRRIIAVADDPSEYRRLTDEAHVRGLPTTVDMATAYDHVYRQVVAQRRRFQPPPPSPIAHGPAVDRSVLRAALLVAGEDGRHPGSVHVRTLRRLQHPALRDEVLPWVADLDRLVRGEGSLRPDLVVVQRTAVPPDRTEELLGWVAESGVALVVDLDDNLVEPHQLPSGSGHERWDLHVTSLQRLLAASHLATVSTGALSTVVERYATTVVVVPNHLDERLWFSPVVDLGAVDGPADELRFLYMGTKTHGGDLLLLRDAVGRAAEELGRPVVLEVVGVEEEGPGQDWYRRLPIPAGTTHYPEFVRWLRSQRGRWDGAVAPLAENEFNGYKSDLKHLEYAALRLPGAYSAIGPYRMSVRDDVNGLLVGPDHRSWAEAMIALGDADRRERIAAAALGEVRATRVLGAHANAYVAELRAAVGRADRPSAAELAPRPRSA